ncbi:MAG: M28 family peptidase [Cyclobacteriaceae bacterium]
MKTLSNFILLLIFLLPVHVFAQKVDSTTLLKDLAYLSSNDLEGRATQTEGNQAAQDYIIERFNQLGMTSQFDGFKQYFPLNNGNRRAENLAVNIIGFIPGSETSKIFLIMAHYDHLGKKGDIIYNGADDNASGTAALLALADYFSENRPFHSIIFAATDAEEKGLLGAKALVNDFPFPLEQISLVINMDMISRSDDNKLYAVGSRHYPHLQPYLSETAKYSSLDLVLGNDGGPGEKDWTHASDHGPFHEEKIPFIYFGVEDHQDYHQPTDTFENIHPEFYTKAVELILRFIRNVDLSVENN